MPLLVLVACDRLRAPVGQSTRTPRQRLAQITHRSLEPLQGERSRPDVLPRPLLLPRLLPRRLLSRRRPRLPATSCSLLLSLPSHRLLLHYRSPLRRCLLLRRLPRRRPLHLLNLHLLHSRLALLQLLLLGIVAVGPGHRGYPALVLSLACCGRVLVLACAGSGHRTRMLRWLL